MRNDPQVRNLRIDRVSSTNDEEFAESTVKASLNEAEAKQMLSRLNSEIPPGRAYTYVIRPMNSPLWRGEFDLI